MMRFVSVSRRIRRLDHDPAACGRGALPRVRHDPVVASLEMDGRLLLVLDALAGAVAAISSMIGQSPIDGRLSPSLTRSRFGALCPKSDAFTRSA